MSVTDTSVGADIIRAVKEGGFAPLEPDRAVKYITASLSGDARMTDLEKAFGTPIDFRPLTGRKQFVVCPG